MRTNIETVESIKELLSQSIINKTDKVSKISDGSVLNAILYGIAKIQQKAMKDSAIIESELFPDFASGIDLDIIASRQGISERLTSSKSSTFIRIHAVEGTVYQKDLHEFKSSSGVSFELITDFTMPSGGYSYVKIRSKTEGSNSNVGANTISTVSPTPEGHKYVTNEYKAIGGRDVEQDDLFRLRIKDSPNYLASGTLNKLTQVFLRQNPNILRTFYKRRDVTGKIVIGVSTQNGADLTDSELNELIQNSEQFLSLTEQKLYSNQTSGIIVENIGYRYIDFDFRVDLYESYDVDEVRQNMQIKISKYLDFRFWDYTKKVEWDNLLDIIKSTPGVRYVPDENFNPRYDISVEKHELPRARGFIMRNVKGNIILDNKGVINPVYYSANEDTSFVDTTLNIE